MADFKIHILRPNGIWLSTFCGREEDTWSDQFAENYFAGLDSVEKCTCKKCLDAVDAYRKRELSKFQQINKY